jgi:cobyrinic acid a,c-diamide synthase
MNAMKSIVIAAPMSGSGKTTVTLGIMECLKRRGLAVAPFKVGPDFIDPGWHRMVTGRPSVNLDGWMCPEQFVRKTFALNSQEADIAIIEGVMGLFDGIDGTSEAGSTAQVAKTLASPVLLVVDARSQARSAAALLKGFADFDPQLKVAGVIFNNVGSANHARLLREAVATSLPGIKVFGCIRRDERLRIPSRHLGLVTAEENPLSGDFLNALAAVIEEQVDLEGLLSLSSMEQVYTFDKNTVNCVDQTPVTIAVARDQAFCFVYEDNLRLLREAGAEIVEFSPLKNPQLPPGINGIYLPGGYPELFAETLSANHGMINAIRSVIEAGMPLYAECGGFIYLTQGVRGQVVPKDAPAAGCPDLIPLAGIFPVATRMLARRKALGYREVELIADSILGPRGTVARGHEFHYSEMEEMPHVVERLYRVRKNDALIGAEGYRYRNCLASYLHLHFGSCPEIAEFFVEACRKNANP